MEQLLALLASFAVAFTTPSFENFKSLVLGAILAPRNRTVTGILRAAGDLAQKHHTTYHRFFSRATWDLWLVAKTLATLVLAIITGVVTLAVDDSTTRRWGPKVYGKGCHRDAVRSSQTYKVHCYGHKWVTVSALVKFPFCKRPWALPLVSLLYLSKSVAESQQHRHRTLIQLACILLYRIKRWFPNRKFVVVGDGGYASTEFSHWCRQHGFTLRSRLRRDAVLYDPPPPRKKGQRGRPAKKGKRQPSFAKRVKDPEAKWTEGTVAWYRGTLHTVRWLTGTGLRYSPGEPVVEVRWVLVYDPDKRSWEVFYSIHPDDLPKNIIESYVERWSLEVTYEESRAHLGLETTRNWCFNSVRRTVPCLLGLFSLVAVWFHEAYDRLASPVAQTPWYSKSEPTFSDALVALRKQLWERIIFSGSAPNACSSKMPEHLWEAICQHLAWTA